MNPVTTETGALGAGLDRGAGGRGTGGGEANRVEAIHHGFERPAGTIYEGEIRHRRFAPRPHEFTYRTSMVYVDCDRIERLCSTTRFAGLGPRSRADRASRPARGGPGSVSRLLSRLRSVASPTLVRYDRRDYFGDPSIPLGEAVRDLVQRHAGTRPAGRVSMLTQLRTLGLAFNPVTFYYCFGATRSDGVEPLEHIVAEITNTPWDERHCYVLSEPVRVATSGARTYRLAKAFHVSPFHPMDHEYRWTFGEPGETLVVHLENHEPNSSSEASGVRKPFDATLTLRREAVFSSRSLLASHLRFPAMTARVLWRIYFQAARLWAKGVPFHAHPASRGEAQRSETS